MNRRIWLGCVAALLVGCAGPQTSSGEYRSHVSTDRLFSAAIQSVAAVGYRVTSADRADGLITAEQNVILGHGSAVGLTVIITRQRAESVLHVTFQAPPGTSPLGDFNLNVVEFVDAVRTGVPDIHAAR
jgi:hypothetical protein